MAINAETLDQLQGEPGWLRDVRRKALASYESLPAPTKTDEEWRRTDVSRLDPGQYSKLERAQSGRPAGAGKNLAEFELGGMYLGRG